MSCTDGQTGEVNEASFESSVTKYFDENGYLCDDIFDDDVSRLHDSLTPNKKKK